ncbi:MAG: hypothetical protein GVY12_01035 [Bacteroidetes bacterium]|jgi:hypothetical protein|nr:hypothetical protein [Bacteroidota bacterium]
MSTPDSDSESTFTDDAIPADAPPHPKVKEIIDRNRDRANAPNPITEATRKRRANPLTNRTP